MTEAAQLAASTAALESHALYRLGLAYGQRVYRLRWFIIALWILALFASASFAAKLPSVLTSGGYTISGSDSVKVADIAQQQLHQPVAQVFVVFQSPDTPVADPTFQREINDFLARVKSYDHVTSAQLGGVGKDGRTALVVVNFDQSADSVQQHLADFRALVPTGAAATPARAYLTGDVAVYDAISQIAQQDVEKADATVFPLALLVLLIVFATLAAAVTPIVLALIAIPIAMALIYAFALHNTTGVSVLSVVTIIGIGLSIDYSLFLTRRFREELVRGRAVPDALGWTLATAGEAIFFSALTVMIGFSGLILLGIPVMTSFGFGGAIVVVVAMLAALTLLPALLSILGPRINSLRLPLLGRLTAERGGERMGFWHGWAMAVMRRPVVVIVLVGVFLLALALPVFSMRLGIPAASSLPASSEVRQGTDILYAQFPDTKNTPIYLAVQTPDGSSILTPDNLAKIDILTQWLASQPHITNVTSLTQLPATPGAPALTSEQLAALYTSGAYAQNPQLAQFVASTTNGGTTLITARSNATLDSDASKAQIDTLRSDYPAHAGGLTVLVGGTQAFSLDFNRYLYGNFPRAILFILLATFLLLMLMFHSVLLPLKAVLMNILSIGAAFGVLVLVFQEGHLSNVLGFTPEGFVDSTTPVLLFCTLFGLSMDYEVFLLSRVREEWLRTRNNRYAVARGLEKTAGVITNAALILVIVTGAITFTTLVATKEIGLGMTVAILVDATVIRILLVPATMRLLGRWNWWFPGRPLPVERPMPADKSA
jgi:RND superfamily putative drug exporter